MSIAILFRFAFFALRFRFVSVVLSFRVQRVFDESVLIFDVVLFVYGTRSFVCLVSNPANVPRWALGTSTGRARYTKGGERNAANKITNFTMNFDCSFVLNSAPRADIPKSAADFILTIIFWFTCALNPDAAPRWQPGLHGTRRCKSKCEVSPIIFWAAVDRHRYRSSFSPRRVDSV